MQLGQHTPDFACASSTRPSRGLETNALAAREPRNARSQFTLKLAAACACASLVGAGAVIGVDWRVRALGTVDAQSSAAQQVSRMAFGGRYRGPTQDVRDQIATGGEAMADDRARQQELYLVRTTLLALDQANRTGNYSVLRALASPDFQLRNSSADLAMIFSNLRANRVDLADAALLTPRWRHPSQRQGGLIRLRGDVATRPRETYFDMQFKLVSNMWRLFALTVSAHEVGVRRQDAKMATPAPKLAKVVRASRVPNR